MKSMKNTLAFSAAAVITIIGVGWYLGWYKVQTSKSVSGNHQVQIDFDNDKIKDDLKKGGEKIADKASEIAEKNRQANEVNGSGSVNSGSGSGTGSGLEFKKPESFQDYGKIIDSTQKR